MSASEFPGNQCPYLATSCPLLKPFAAAFAANSGDGSNSSGPSPSACASAHSSPQSHLPPPTSQHNNQASYDPYGGPSVPIHSLHGPSSGYDGHGHGQAQYQQQTNQHETGRRQPDGPTNHSSYSNQPSSSAYPRPPIDARNSYTTSSSTSAATTSNVTGTRYGRSSPSPPRDCVRQQASSSRASANDEPPTPNSFLRSPPLGPIAHLQQPVFPHPPQHQQHPAESRHEPEHQRYESASSSDPYGSYATSSTYDNGRDYSNGAASSSFQASTRGGYGSFAAEDIEDLSFNRPPSAYGGLVQADDERKVFANVQEVAEPSHGPEEAVGEQTAFISKLWHLLTHPEYTRYLRWSKDGQAFILTNSNEFAIKVLPRFFRHSNVASFVRQLNLYSFQRVSTIRLLDMADSSTSTSINPDHPDSHTHPSHAFGHDSDSEDHHSSHSGGSPPPTDSSTVTASGFTHPHFQRDHPELLKLLKPRGSTRKSGKDSVAGKKAAAAVRDEEDRRGGLKRAASSRNKK